MLRRSRWPAVALFLLALVVRLGFLATDPHPFADSGLAADSAEVARQIDAHGRWFTSNMTALDQLGALQDRRLRLIDPATVDFRAADARAVMQPEALEPPGEPVVLAAIWKLTGSERWLPYQLLMVVLGALMTPLVAGISTRLFRRTGAAYLAGVLYAVFPPLAWLCSVPHLDAWAVDLTIVITALLLSARDAERPRRLLLLAGVAVGVGCYFRPEVLLLAPVVALATVTRSAWRDALQLGALPTLVALVILLPWTIRNAERFTRSSPCGSALARRSGRASASCPTPSALYSTTRSPTGRSMRCGLISSTGRRHTTRTCSPRPSPRSKLTPASTRDWCSTG